MTERTSESLVDSFSAEGWTVERRSDGSVLLTKATDANSAKSDGAESGGEKQPKETLKLVGAIVRNFITGKNE